MKLFRQFEKWKDFDAQESSNIGQKLLRDLYQHAKISLSTLLGLSILIFVLIIGKVPGELLYPWFTLAVMIILSRLYDAYRYLGGDRSKTYRQWYQTFVVKSLLTALLWGSISLLLLPYIEDQSIKNIIFLLVIGIGSGAMTSISPNIRMAASYLFLLLSPLFVYFVMQGDSANYLLAVMLLAYFLLLINVSRNIGNTLIKSYEEEERYKRTQRELYDKQEELDLIFKSTPIGIMYVDTDYKVIDFNLAYAELFKRKREELLGMNLDEVPDQRPVRALMEGKSGYSGPYKSFLGMDLWMDMRFSPLVNSEGKKLGTVVLIDDKTAEKKAIDELNYLVHHDDLTSLANRRGFLEYMQKLIQNNKHHTHYSILFYLDLNQFKTINDTLGHSVGDALLKLVAERLKPLIKRKDILSRLGGDEFGIVLPFVAKNKQKAWEIADQCGANLQNAFASPFAVEEMFLYVRCSIGIVIIEPEMDDIEEIVRYADISMYSAKRKGRSAIAYYNQGLDAKRKELFGLQHDLYYAIEIDQLKLYYQPIVSIKDDALQAAEALIRWHHPKLGILSPDQFIPLAVESGLIDSIGWLVIDSVCKQIAEWKRASLFMLEYISINVSAIQFQRVNFVEKLMGKLGEYSVDPSDIKLEVTESSLIDNFEQTRDIINKLQEEGVHCAIDDFGTGYSSLSYLRKFSFSVLKIDKEFIKDIPKKSDNAFLTESIISIGKKLGYHIIIEGIETEEQKEFLLKLDDSLCYQGFLYSPALTAEKFREGELEK